MARFDKYEPYGGGFRAPLAAAITAGTDNVNLNKVYAVALNSSGRLIRSSIGAAADIVGVIVPMEAKAAGDVIDVMTDGEIVEYLVSAGTAATPGTPQYGHLDGTVSETATAGQRLGHTVEAGRLVVRVAR